MRKLPRWLKPVARLLVGGTVITFLLLRTDVASIGHALVSAQPWAIVAGNALNIVLLVVSAFRWRVFLLALGANLRAGSVLRLTFVGSFFNAFLPTGVGGDAYKAVRIRTATRGLASSFASVILDRMSGIAALAAVALPFAAALMLTRMTPAVPIAIGLSTSVLIAVAGVALLGERAVGPGRRTWFGLRPRLRRTLAEMAVAFENRAAIRQAAALGLLSQSVYIAAHVALAWALALDVPLAVITLGLLIATIASAIPVTISGLGIREAVWVWILGLYGVAQAEALAYALLILGMSLTSSAVGGIVYGVAGGELGEVKRS